MMPCSQLRQLRHKGLNRSENASMSGFATLQMRYPLLVLHHQSLRVQESLLAPFHQVALLYNQSLFRKLNENGLDTLLTLYLFPLRFR